MNPKFVKIFDSAYNPLNFIINCFYISFRKPLQKQNQVQVSIAKLNSKLKTRINLKKTVKIK